MINVGADLFIVITILVIIYILYVFLYQLSNAVTCAVMETVDINWTCGSLGWGHLCPMAFSVE